MYSKILDTVHRGINATQQSINPKLGVSVVRISPSLSPHLSSAVGPGSLKTEKSLKVGTHRVPVRTVPTET